jgi:hypothetical protein
MRTLKPIILFVLSFLVSIEIFLYLNIRANMFSIIPISLLIAGVVVVLRKPVIHNYKMLFDESYKKRKKYKGSHRHHRHSSGSGRHSYRQGLNGNTSRVSNLQH